MVIPSEASFEDLSKISLKTNIVQIILLKLRSVFISSVRKRRDFSLHDYSDS